jgi:hypothetical protein
MVIEHEHELIHEVIDGLLSAAHIFECPGELDNCGNFTLHLILFLFIYVNSKGYTSYIINLFPSVG